MVGNNIIIYIETQRMMALQVIQGVAKNKSLSLCLSYTQVLNYLFHCTRADKDTCIGLSSSPSCATTNVSNFLNRVHNILCGIK